MERRHHENHNLSKAGWLRAAVLGANDGILSTASLVLGVATASGSHGAILISGVSGLVAGALSMAAGEYVSVSSQADLENAELEQEKRELAKNPKGELRELKEIYEERGLKPALAGAVAEELSRKDPLAAHAQDELGISTELRARPVQAALASAASFSTGALIPVAAAYFSPQSATVPAVYICSLVCLVMLGALGARAGGAPVWAGALRVLIWGAFAMAATGAIGLLFHVQV